MPVLDIRPEAIAAPLRVDIARIESVMLYPAVDEGEARERTFSYGASRALIDSLQAGEIDPEHLTRDELANAISMALESDRSEVARGLSEPRYMDGMAVGAMILETLLPAGESLSLSSAKERLGNRIGKARKAGQGEKVTEERWRLFRPAAHLWGASAHLFNSQPDAAMPFDFRRLAEFLALAEFLLARGCAHRVEGKRPAGFAANTLLDRSVAWHPAEHIVSALPIRWQFGAH
jgi:hypothetical protein